MKKKFLFFKLHWNQHLQVVDNQWSRENTCSTYRGMEIKHLNTSGVLFILWKRQKIKKRTLLSSILCTCFIYGYFNKSALVDLYMTCWDNKLALEWWFDQTFDVQLPTILDTCNRQYYYFSKPDTLSSKSTL